MIKISALIIVVGILCTAESITANLIGVGLLYIIAIIEWRIECLNSKK